MYKLPVLVVMSALLLISSVSAANVGLGFPESVTVTQGETFERSISVQYPVATEGPVTVEIIVEEGSDFISLVGSSNLELTEDVTSVPLMIDASDLSVGTHTGRVVVRPSDSGAEGGTVDFVLSTALTVNAIVVAPVVDGETPAPETSGGLGGIIWWIAGAVIVVVLIVVVVMRRSHSKTALPNAAPGMAGMNRTEMPTDSSTDTEMKK